jgi:hypothetical protein
MAKRATRSEVENAIKLWLRYARDWDGGRQARRSRRSPQRAGDSSASDYD